MLPILYQDDQLVAVDKPAGLLVHRTLLDAHEHRFAVQLLRRQLGRRVHPVHRLDKGASGVLLFALTREVATALGGMLARQEVRKTYLAVVRGHPPETGEIDRPLARRLDPVEVDAHTPPGAPQPASTRFRRLATVELPVRVDRYPTSRYALLELQPLTGRRHQLRRHLAHAAHPILGDASYGAGRHNRFFAERFGFRRLLLACVELRLAHPVTGRAVSIAAPVSGEFAGLIRELGWAEAVPQAWLAPAPAAAG